MPDYYKILDIERDASQDDIKRAYRKQALRFHPDQNLGNVTAEEQFKQIVEAYRVLGEPGRRRFYDRFGMEREALARVDPGSARAGLEDLVTNVMDELLRRPKVKPVPGKDRKYELEVRFAEAALGVERSVQVPLTASCGGCAGSGAAAGSSQRRCHVCEGRGEVREPGPFYAFRKVCPFCEGRGAVVGASCTRCGGTGAEILDQTLSIRVPPGSEDGLRLRYRGAGEPGRNGGPDGDLYVIVKVLEDPLFVRSGYDVIVKVPLTVPEAVAGTRVQVPMIDGVVRLSIPPGTQPGRRFRLRERGIPLPRGRGRGDAYVEVTVTLPESETVRELLHRWPDACAHAERKRYDALVREHASRSADEETA